MIETEQDFKAFTKDFKTMVKVDGKDANAILSKGSSRERTIRGTVISDSRSFLVGVIPWAKEGSRVMIGEDTFTIEQIEEKAGISSYYLKKDWHHEQFSN